jgi:hypothetical protein
MENEILAKPRLIIILVVATVVVFIALVWLIAAFQPWELLGVQNPTASASQQAAINCTHATSYWADHPELLPQQVIIGGVVYKERELEALLSDDSQDVAQQLRMQLAVVFLNSQSGADQSAIEGVIFQAYGWLVQHPAGSQVTEDELAAGRRYHDELEAYNLGQGGVNPCEASQLMTKTSTLPATVITELSPTTSLTVTSTPSVSPTPTAYTATATIGFASPTTRPTQTSEPPVQHPTNTPNEPTKAPTPTNTPKPTDVPTFTPSPSPAPTLPPSPTPSPTLPPPGTSNP